MSHLSSQRLSELTGLTKRHCQRLLTSGEVPCAERTSGGHWRIPDNAKVRRWIEKQKSTKHARKPRVYSVPELPVIYRAKKIAETDGQDSNVDALSAIKRCQRNLKSAAMTMQNAIAATHENAHAAGLFLMDARNQFPDAKVWRQWLKTNKIEFSEARDLINFAKWAEQGNRSTDSRFLLKFGVIKNSQKDRHEKPTKGIGPNWLAWTGKLTGYFGEMTKQHPIETWHEEQRDAVAAQLHPLAELFQKIKVLEE